jgi:anaerobic glycerol-3-phosphate dehydrogenase subunit B
MNPVDATGKVIAANLYCVGELIAGGAPWRELSGEGIALGSAWAAIQAAKTQLGLGGEEAGTTPPAKTATSGAGQAGGLEPGNDDGNLEPGHNPTPKRKRTGKNRTNTTKTAQKEAAK